MERTDIAIIGGGAAGLTSAIFAAQAIAEADENQAPPDEPRVSASVPRITIFDTAKILGAKILVSGGGRCNVTHRAVGAADFNGHQPVVRNILAAFNVEATTRWFDTLGVTLKLEETGKLFPISDSAKTVVHALLDRCETLGVQRATERRVEAIERDGKDFIVRHSRGQTRASRLIFCTGGKSLPLTGSDGSAWEILAGLGHSVTTTHAALVPLALDPTMFHAELSGLSHAAELIVGVSNKPIDRRTGSLLWTHFGISGPVVMDASRHWTTARDLERMPTLKLNFLPGRTPEAAEKWLLELAASRPKGTVLRGLTTALYERVAAALLTHLKIASDLPLARLPKATRRTLAATLTGLALPVSQHRGWNYAEVTAGGVPLSEIDFRTMASRKVPKLYLAGEVLDCDGRIGGFNFQWAWATGYLAGRAAAGDFLARQQSGDGA